MNRNAADPPPAVTCQLSSMTPRDDYLSSLGFGMLHWNSGCSQHCTLTCRGPLSRLVLFASSLRLFLSSFSFSLTPPPVHLASLVLPPHNPLYSLFLFSLLSPPPPPPPRHAASGSRSSSERAVRRSPRLSRRPDDRERVWTDPHRVYTRHAAVSSHGHGETSCSAHDH